MEWHKERPWARSDSSKKEINHLVEVLVSFNITWTNSSNWYLNVTFSSNQKLLCSIVPSPPPFLFVFISLQRTSRLPGWRKRIYFSGGFLCALTPPPHPKLIPAHSPGTCLMEETTTSTTSAQVEKQQDAAMYLFHTNQRSSAAAY